MHPLSNPLSLTIELFSDSVPSPFRALVNSGSLHCFVDSDFAEKYHLTTLPVSPLRLQLFDGTSNETITWTASIPLHFPSGENLSVNFYVSPLNNSVSAVLAYSWLSAYNLLIDWKKRSI